LREPASKKEEGRVDKGGDMGKGKEKKKNGRKGMGRQGRERNCPGSENPLRYAQDQELSG